MPTLCADCFKGTLHGDVKPQGKEEKIHGLDVYVARPEEGKKPIGLVVIISDIFGWATPNARGLADSYARHGPFLVYVPDFMNGCASSPECFDYIDEVKLPSPDWYTTLVMKPWWAWQILSQFGVFGWRCRMSVSKPRIFGFFQAIRQSPPPGELDPDAPLKVGAVGFCWGGKYTVLLAQDTPSSRVPVHGGSRIVPLVDAAFTGHPAMLDIPQDMTDLKVPLSVANGPDDEWMGTENMKKMTAVLEAQGRHEVVVYQGARHGFAIRGNPRDSKQAEMGMMARDQAVKWFRKHFKS